MNWTERGPEWNSLLSLNRERRSHSAPSPLTQPAATPFQQSDVNSKYLETLILHSGTPGSGTLGTLRDVATLLRVGSRDWC